MMHLVDITFYRDCNMKLCQNRKRINCKQGPGPQSAPGGLTLGPFPALPPPFCSLPTGTHISQWALQILNREIREASVLLHSIRDMVTQCRARCYLLQGEPHSAPVGLWLTPISGLTKRHAAGSSFVFHLKWYFIVTWKDTTLIWSSRALSRYSSSS